MRRKLRKILFVIMYYTGITALFYQINREKQRILVFHHIIPDHCSNNSFEQSIVCTTKGRFKELMEQVNKRFRIVTDAGVPGTAMITFDDGYRAALNAADVLEYFGNKCVIFMPVNAVGAEALWIDRIMAWFAYVPDNTYKINGVVCDLHDTNSRQKAYSVIIDSLYKMGSYIPGTIIEELDELFPFADLNIPEEYYSFRFRGLTSSEIDRLKDAGHKFGGHSVSHDILSCLTEDELHRDFQICSSGMNTLYNSDIYAYPFGHQRDVNEATYRMLEKSAFNYGVMNESVKDEKNYCLSRINISHYDNKYEIDAALSGLTFWLKSIF